MRKIRKARGHHVNWSSFCKLVSRKKTRESCPKMEPTPEKRFRAYDLTGQNPHTVPNVTRIEANRLRRGEWRQSLSEILTTAEEEEQVRRLIRCENEEITCEHCQLVGSDPRCTSDCYTAFVAENFSVPLVELRGPGPLGYAAFVRQGVRVRKDECIGEYVGELRPMKRVERELQTGKQSMYRFDFPPTPSVVLDSEYAGNWTRFMNSSCVANVLCWATFVGKRHVVFFRAARDIDEGEELCFNYGPGYFESANIQCGCPLFDEPHSPGRKRLS